MSKLQVDILESKSGIGLTCTPEELFNQRAFAWVSFNDDEIDESFNIDSVVDEGVGRRTCNFGTNAINDRYAILGSTGTGNNDNTTTLMAVIAPSQRVDGSSGLTVSSFHIKNLTLNPDESVLVSSRDYVSVVVFGGY